MNFLERAKFFTAFEGHFSLKVLKVATNTGDSGKLILGSENH